jgi:hypothetical protein
MKIPGLGEVTKDENLGLSYSRPVSLAVLGGAECCIALEGYDEDANKGDFHAAISNLLSASPSVLREAEGHVYQYYQDMRRLSSESDDEPVSIASPADVWHHVDFGSEPVVSRRPYGDRRVYVSLECSCDWEAEHGLQIVFREGKRVCKVGPFDGHLTNADAYADDALEDVVYRRLA